MEDLILCSVFFLICFIVRLINYRFNHIKKNKDSLSMEMKYLVNKYKLSKTKVKSRGIIIIISLLDALILVGTMELTTLITDKIWLEMIISIPLVLVLLLIIYHIFGLILLKKGYDKNE